MVRELDLVDHRDTIAKEAFRILLDGATLLPIARLAERVSADENLVRKVLNDLKLIGRAELDGDTLLGIYGLTLKPTRHRLEMRGATYFTWCAWDIVGIPAALGESAEVTSECAHCQNVVRVVITDGEPPASAVVVSWLSERCESIREQFCPTVNFYCDSTHYEAALSAGQAPNSCLTLERAAEMGRENWGWAR